MEDDFLQGLMATSVSYTDKNDPNDIYLLTPDKGLLNSQQNSQELVINNQLNHAMDQIIDKNKASTPQGLKKDSVNLLNEYFESIQANPYKPLEQTNQQSANMVTQDRLDLILKNAKTIVNEFRQFKRYSDEINNSN